MTIGEKIKNRRIELGWSQQTLATKMGYTNKSTITRIEKGYNDVSQKNIAKFADVLGVSIAYLMDWDEEPDSEEESTTKADSLLQQHIDNYSHLPSEWQMTIDELVKALQEEPQDADKVWSIFQKISKILQS